MMKLVQNYLQANAEGNVAIVINKKHTMLIEALQDRVKSPLLQERVEVEIFTEGNVAEKQFESRLKESGYNLILTDEAEKPEIDFFHRRNHGFDVVHFSSRLTYRSLGYSFPNHFVLDKSLRQTQALTKLSRKLHEKVCAAAAEGNNNNKRNHRGRVRDSETYTDWEIKDGLDIIGQKARTVTHQIRDRDIFTKNCISYMKELYDKVLGKNQIDPSFLVVSDCDLNLDPDSEEKNTKNKTKKNSSGRSFTWICDEKRKFDMYYLSKADNAKAYAVRGRQWQVVFIILTDALMQNSAEILEIVTRATTSVETHLRFDAGKLKNHLKNSPSIMAFAEETDFQDRPYGYMKRSKKRNL